MGTPVYCAPEQIRGARVDGRADQYALACVAFVLLTGNPAVPSRSDTMATLFAHVHDPVPLLTARRPELPEAVNAVVARALAKSPADRYGRCSEFAAALLDSTAPARPTISPLRPPSPAPMRPATSPARPPSPAPARPPVRPQPARPPMDVSPGQFAQQGHGTDSLPLPAGRAARGNTFRTKALMATSGVIALLTAVIAIVANMTGGPPHSPGAPQQTATGAAATGSRARRRRVPPLGRRVPPQGSRAPRRVVLPCLLTTLPG